MIVLDFSELKRDARPAGCAGLRQNAALDQPLPDGHADAGAGLHGAVVHADGHPPLLRSPLCRFCEQS